MRNCSEAHVKILFQNSGDIRAANIDSVLSFDNFYDLGCCPDACLFLLSDGVNCELELTLFVALFDSKLADVVRFFFYPTD
jgi:hypothetical protein